VRLCLLPCFLVQRRIAGELAERVAETRRLQETLEARLAALDRLPAALLREVFGGQAAVGEGP